MRIVSNPPSINDKSKTVVSNILLKYAMIAKSVPDRQVDRRLRGFVRERQLGILLTNIKGIMKIIGYVVVWTRLLGIVNGLVGIGMVFFPSAMLQLIGLAPTTSLMLLPRLTGVIFFVVGNLYFFGLLESRRDESYEPLRQVWIISACFLLCVALVLGCLVLWGLLGNEEGGIAFSLTTAFVGGWQLIVILAKKFPSNG